MTNSYVYQLYWFSTSIHFLTNLFDKLIQHKFYIQQILLIYIRLVRMQDNIKHDTMFSIVLLTSPPDFNEILVAHVFAHVDGMDVSRESTSRTDWPREDSKHRIKPEKKEVAHRRDG